jgi:hypothetical protein
MRRPPRPAAWMQPPPWVAPVRMPPRRSRAACVGGWAALRNREMGEKGEKGTDIALGHGDRVNDVNLMPNYEQ